MKKQLFVMSILCSILFIGSFCTAKKSVVAETTPPAQPEVQEEPAFITAIKEKIKGKEQMPAEEVFENIQILKGMPAERVLPIMRMAFNNSLGVKCNHCHEFGKWADDTKPAKQITRDMWAMTAKINRELLAEIKNLDSEKPSINCTTCHRGKVKPAKEM